MTIYGLQRLVASFDHTKWMLNLSLFMNEAQKCYGDFLVQSITSFKNKIIQICIFKHEFGQFFFYFHIESEDLTRQNQTIQMKNLSLSLNKK